MRNDDLKKIGFWRSKHEPDLPIASHFVDSSWPDWERLLVAEYVKNGQYLSAEKGQSECRICGKSNGSKNLGDDVYVWPDGFYHYIAHHYVKPPQEFIDHVNTAVMKNYLNSKHAWICGCRMGSS